MLHHFVVLLEGGLICVGRDDCPWCRSWRSRRGDLLVVVGGGQVAGWFAFRRAALGLSFQVKQLGFPPGCCRSPAGSIPARHARGSQVVLLGLGCAAGAPHAGVPQIPATFRVACSNSRALSKPRPANARKFRLRGS